MKRPNHPAVLFDATSDPDILCIGCRHRLTKSNAWSSWLYQECHDAEVWRRGDYRTEVIDALRRYVSPKLKHFLPALAVVAGLGAGVIVGRRLRHG